jgi:hypothetical protein
MILIGRKCGGSVYAAALHNGIAKCLYSDGFGKQGSAHSGGKIHFSSPQNPHRPRGLRSCL